MYIQAISCRRNVHSNVVRPRAPVVEQQSTNYPTAGSHGVSERPSAACRLASAAARRFEVLSYKCFGGAAAVYSHGRARYCHWISLRLMDTEKFTSGCRCGV